MPGIGADRAATAGDRHERTPCRPALRRPQVEDADEITACRCFSSNSRELSYATNLADAAHYYRQHQRLMKHWLSILGENIFTLDYDRLVREPEPVLHELLSFLRLEWDVRCLDIRQRNGNVRTASVWQVRDALHAESSGRWQLYESHIAETRAWLEANPAPGEAAP